MNAPAFDARPDHLPLLNRRPLSIAAAFSLATVVLVFVWLAVAAMLVGGAGVAVAARARTTSSAGRAAFVTSIGFGLAVGPSVYLLLAVIVSVT